MGKCSVNTGEKHVLFNISSLTNIYSSANSHQNSISVPFICLCLLFSFLFLWHCAGLLRPFSFSLSCLLARFVWLSFLWRCQNDGFLLCWCKACARLWFFVRGPCPRNAIFQTLSFQRRRVTSEPKHRRDLKTNTHCKIRWMLKVTTRRHCVCQWSSEAAVDVMTATVTFCHLLFCCPGRYNWHFLVLFFFRDCDHFESTLYTSRSCPIVAHISRSWRKKEAELFHQASHGLVDKKENIKRCAQETHIESNEFLVWKTPVSLRSLQKHGLVQVPNREKIVASNNGCSVATGLIQRLSDRHLVVIVADILLQGRASGFTTMAATQ